MVYCLDMIPWGPVPVSLPANADLQPPLAVEPLYPPGGGVGVANRGFFLFSTKSPLLDVWEVCCCYSLFPHRAHCITPKMPTALVTGATGVFPP
jgi:hypothetical protein